MAENLILRLRDDTQLFSFVVTDADGRLLQSRRESRLSDLHAAAAGRRLIVLVPGDDVIVTRTPMPQVGKARLRQMLPFTLEDQLAEDVSVLHFAAGERLENGDVEVAVIARARLQEWLDLLAEAELVPAAVYADCEGVADTPNTLALIAEGDSILARRSGESALALTGMTLADTLEILEPDEDDRSRNVMVSLTEADHQLRSDEIAQLTSAREHVDVRRLADDALPILAAGIVSHPGTNLLQGTFAPKSNWGALFQPWRLAAVLAGVLLATAVVGSIVDFVQLRRTDAALTATLEQRCTEQLRTANLRQCEAEITSRLGTTSSSGADTSQDFLNTLSRIAQTSDEQDALRQLSYRNAVMDVQIFAQSVPALDEFSRRLEDSGDFASVTVQSTNPQPEGVEARVQIVGVNR